MVESSAPRSRRTAAGCSWIRRPEVRAATHPGSPVALRKVSTSGYTRISMPPGGAPPIFARDLFHLAFGPCQHDAVAVRLRRHQRHCLAAHALPGDATRRQPEYCARIVELQNLAIAVTLDA